MAVSDSDRLQAALNLYNQARARFRELETIEWRVNFSAWGLVIASAYALLRADVLGGQHFGDRAALAWLAPVVHFAAMVKLHLSSHGWRLAADRYRDIAKSLADIPYDSRPTTTRGKPVCGLLPSDWTWILLQVTVTLVGAYVVVRLAW